MYRDMANIIREWKREAGVKYPCLFKYNSVEHSITIFTSMPGFFIGRGGCLVDKYKKKLNSQLYVRRIETIKFVETEPITI